jgi:hypothetical protein
VHLLYSRHPLDDVLGQTLRLAAINRARQRHFTALDFALDLPGIEVPVLGQSFTDVFVDPLVRAL